ncbi:hypothetical protein VCHA36P166_10086 [Vibrio chagasii]|nr:hypothetical protein VCHA36P166_10086 [Vibrio chagasii]
MLAWLDANFELECFCIIVLSLFAKVINDMNKFTNNLILVFVAAILNGCGEGSSNNDTGNNQSSEKPTQNTKVSYSAIDALRTSQLSDEFYVDLSKNINSSDGSDVSITNVRVMGTDRSCQPLYIDDKGFTIEASFANVCEYEYSVGSKNGMNSTSPTQQNSRGTQNTVSDPASARVTTAVGDSVVIAPHLSAVTSEGTAIKVDVSHSITNADYTLSSEVYLPYGSHSSSSAVALPSSNEILYTPAPGFVGVERVSYSYSDGGESLVFGELDISVSTSSNHAPVASDFEYQGENGSTIIGNGEKVEINIWDYIPTYDVDGDVVFLEGVTSYDAIVTTNGYDLMSFSSTQPGTHYVSYTVKDVEMKDGSLGADKGGYSTGVMKITVEADPSLIRTWRDITSHNSHYGVDQTLTAPMTKAEVDYVNLSYSDTYVGDGADIPAYTEVALHTFDEARDVCKAKGGRLPILNEVITSLGEFDDSGWPEGINYWLDSVEGTGGASRHAYSYNYQSRTYGLELYSEARLVTCIIYDDPAIPKYSIEQETFDVVGDKLRYRFVLMTPGMDVAQNVKNINVSSSINYKGKFDKEFYDADNDGVIEAYYDDLSFEDNIALVSVYGLVNKSIIDSSIANYGLDVTANEEWNRELTEDNLGYGLPPIDSVYGLPVAVTERRITSVYNKQSYVGESFIGRFESYQANGVGGGRYSFYIQQESSVPDPLTWGQDVLRPGGPDDKNFEIVIDMFKRSVKVYIDASPGDEADFSFEDIDLRYNRYIWFEAQDGEFSLYTALTPMKPQFPLLSFAMDWGNIDPNSMYWVGFGGRVAGGTTQTYIREAYFKSTND